jgi:hypothetical protein
MDGHDAAIHPRAIPQLRQRGIRLFLYEFLQPIQFLARKLRRPSTSVRFGCNRSPFPSTLQEPTNPCRTDPEKPGDLFSPALLLITGPHDPFPQIH